MSNIKGFITDINNNKILPITRGELVLDENAEVALRSSIFAANENQYGLLSPTHYSVLASLGSPDDLDENSLAGILARLTAINEGIKVGNTTLNFYDKNNNNQSTPIYFEASDPISLTANSNKITVSLKPLKENTTTTENVVANIKVDKYGRVTEISPTTALSGVNLTGCTSSDVADNAQQEAIVNKRYVDEKFSEISAISTGALKFEGPIDTANNIATLLKEGYYYLAANTLYDLEASLFHGKTQNVTVNRGDTLIAHSMQGQLKFTIIPSGDDKTIINLSDTSSNPNTTTIGVGTSNVTFAYPFSLNNDTNATIISIPEASYSTAGIISADLFGKIDQATAKSMTYSPTLTDGVPLGEITIGNESATPITIYSPNYSLKYESNAIKWSGHANEKLNIKFEGGLQPTYSSDTCTVNLVTDNKYLTVEEGALKAVISQVSNDEFTTGLIDNILFDNYMTALATVTTYYKPISKSLSNNDPEDDGKNYQYGSPELKNAIAITI